MNDMMLIELYGSASSDNYLNTDNVTISKFVPLSRSKCCANNGVFKT